jgi:hypothetical protein
MALIPIGKIKPNPNNPRVIKDDKFHKLVESVKSFPEMSEVREIVVNKDMVILGGNMRYRAMKEAGIKEVHVRVVDWPEEKQKEFVIKDNVSGGEWDWDVLANEWDAEDLDDWGLDAPIYEEPEIDLKTEEPDFTQITFTVHVSQKTIIDSAIAKAKEYITGDEPNQNNNGNSLFYVCEKYCEN